MLIQKKIFLNEKCKYKGHLFTSLQMSLKSDIIGMSGFPCLPSHCLLWCVVLLGGDEGGEGRLLQRMPARKSAVLRHLKKAETPFLTTGSSTTSVPWFIMILWILWS